MVVYNASVNLDYERAVYYPGQVVSGVVELQLAQPLTFSVLYATYLGEANVEWVETESETYNGQKRHKQIKYVGREEYFKFTQSLAGGGAESTHFQEGSHKFPISFQIPYNVPSSFSGERGAVTYSVRVQMLFQGRAMFDQEVVKYFEVVAPFDLNKGNDMIKQPTDLEFDEIYSCCCSSNPVSVRVRLPVTGYCPGQLVPVTVEADNRSNIEITKMIFELITKECYRTQHPVSEYISPAAVLSRVTRGAVLGGTRRNFTVELQVPEIVVPNLENCQIIDVGYFFKVTIKLSGCNDDLEDESEICLGLVPLHETVEGTYTHPMSHSLPQGPIPEPPDNEITQNTVNGSQNMITQAQNMTQMAQNQAQNIMNQMGFQTNMPPGSTCYVEYKSQVTSSDPSQNYQIGFKVSYPPDSNAQMTVFNNQFNPNLSMPSAPPPP